MESMQEKSTSVRIASLDYARWIFAFLVVIIHIPLMGGSYLMPIAWCAVPFFYMVTGFFLYDSNPTKIGAKITKAENLGYFFRFTYIYCIHLESDILKSIRLVFKRHYRFILSLR